MCQQYFGVVSTLVTLFVFYLNRPPSELPSRFKLFPLPSPCPRPVDLRSIMAPVAASTTPIVSPLPRSLPNIVANDNKVAARKRLEAVYAVVRDELLAEFRIRNMPEESMDCQRVRTAPPPMHMLLFPLLPNLPTNVR